MSNLNPLDVIKAHWHRTPVPVETIIRDLGLAFSRRPLDDDVSGWIEKTARGYEIVVNSNHSPTRQRFTAAHELGHYIYHRSLLGDGVGDNRAYRAQGSPRPNASILPIHERQANSFAANVLMPRHALSNVPANADLTALARQFAVSEEAMRIRLGL